jgi:hypothetical protein
MDGLVLRPTRLMTLGRTPPSDAGQNSTGESPRGTSSPMPAVEDCRRYAGPRPKLPIAQPLTCDSRPRHNVSGSGARSPAAYTEAPRRWMYPTLGAGWPSSSWSSSDTRRAISSAVIGSSAQPSFARPADSSRLAPVGRGPGLYGCGPAIRRGRRPRPAARPRGRRARRPGRRRLRPPGAAGRGLRRRWSRLPRRSAARRWDDPLASPSCGQAAAVHSPSWAAWFKSSSAGASAQWLGPRSSLG